jgi:hypothetical protein
MSDSEATASPYNSDVEQEEPPVEHMEESVVKALVAIREDDADSFQRIAKQLPLQQFLIEYALQHEAHGCLEVMLTSVESCYEMAIDMCRLWRGLNDLYFQRFHFSFPSFQFIHTHRFALYSTNSPKVIRMTNRCVLLEKAYEQKQRRGLLLDFLTVSGVSLYFVGCSLFSLYAIMHPNKLAKINGLCCFSLGIYAIRDNVRTWRHRWEEFRSLFFEE